MSMFGHHAPRTVELDEVLEVPLVRDQGPGSLPLAFADPLLRLEEDHGSECEGCQIPRSSAQLVVFCLLAASHCKLALFLVQEPRGVGAILARMDWHVVPQLPAEDDLGRT